MFIKELGRHLTVSSIPELERTLKRDAGFWNVVSIREPAVPRPAALRYAKRVHEVIFEDREEIDPDVPGVFPRKRHLAGIFQFVDAHPGEHTIAVRVQDEYENEAVEKTIVRR